MRGRGRVYMYDGGRVSRVAGGDEGCPGLLVGLFVLGFRAKGRGGYVPGLGGWFIIWASSSAALIGSAVLDQSWPSFTPVATYPSSFIYYCLILDLYPSIFPVLWKL